MSATTESKLNPEKAAAALKKGLWKGPAQVSGRLKLLDYPFEELPRGLHCYDLDLTRSRLVSLPDDLVVENRLILDESLALRHLPPGLTAGSISLRGCTSLVTLPEGIRTWFLDLTGCTRFERWPQESHVEHGALLLRGCTALTSLPPWLGRLSQLDISGCEKIRAIPSGVRISSWLDLGGSGVTALPAALQDVDLRWRGVRVDQRIAFRPEELKAAEVLAERNTERRRVMIERMGNLRFLQEARARVLDQDTDPGGPRELLAIDLREDEPMVGLSCRCPSTGRQYLLRVPPNMRSCHQAAAWIAGFDDPRLYRPEVET